MHCDGYYSCPVPENHDLFDVISFADGDGISNGSRADARFVKKVGSTLEEKVGVVDSESESSENNDKKWGALRL